MTNYTINKSFNSRVDRTQRVLEVAEAFGLGLDDKEFIIYKDLSLDVNKGDVVYITGQSGSGKSLLLKELAKQMSDEGLSVSDVDKILWDKDSPLIDQVGKDMGEAVRVLSVAGINDAYLLIRTPGQLSDGQFYRFFLAKLIESGSDVWVADEFGAKLDRVTAKAVAFCMQKMARELGKTLIVATTHTDLEKELGPNITINKFYMDKISIKND